jgi:hypothetical protein
VHHINFWKTLHRGGTRQCHIRLQHKWHVSKIVRKILYQFIFPYFPLISASKLRAKAFHYLSPWLLLRAHLEQMVVIPFD